MTPLPWGSGPLREAGWVVAPCDTMRRTPGGLQVREASVRARLAALLVASEGSPEDELALWDEPVNGQPVADLIVEAVRQRATALRGIAAGFPVAGPDVAALVLDVTREAGVQPTWDVRRNARSALAIRLDWPGMDPLCVERAPLVERPGGRLPVSPDQWRQVDPGLFDGEVLTDRQEAMRLAPGQVDEGQPVLVAAAGRFA